ncbi:MAG: hypothetical protein RMJ67_06070 [Elusimicrobiota bacterium]|nr:hypothetical protein [Endomicrobiia bacterium]MDW8166059.1 hypothetical protein [Elusimicrobiota bacterium]
MNKIIVLNFHLLPLQRKYESYNLNYDYEISVNELVIVSNNPFKFNLTISGSSTWLANELVRSDGIFWGILPFRFQKPFIIPRRSGLTIEFEEFNNTEIRGQIILSGYII